MTTGVLDMRAGTPLAHQHLGQRHLAGKWLIRKL